MNLGYASQEDVAREPSARGPRTFPTIRAQEAVNALEAPHPEKHVTVKAMTRTGAAGPTPGLSRQV